MTDRDAFPTLDPVQMRMLDSFGARRTIAVGDYLFREGEAMYDFFVVVSGAIEVVAGAMGAEQTVARYGAGGFLGELNLLTGMRVFLSARVVEAGEVIVVSRDDLRRVITTEVLLSDLILTAFLARRKWLLKDAASTMQVIGSRFSPETGRVREFLLRSQIPHEWLDPDADATAESLLQFMAARVSDLPVVVASGSILRHATPGMVADYLGLTVGELPEQCFDLIVVGGGPAGLASSVYGASEGLRTIALDMVAIGGQAGGSTRIENYLGFPMGISGADLMQQAMVQAEKFGAQLASPCAVEALGEEAGHLSVRLSDGRSLAGRAVIAATGVHYRRLQAEGLGDFEYRGVYYAATETERRACTQSPVVVVGGGNSAGQAALFLAAGGSHVTVVIRGSDLGRSMSRYLVDRIEADHRISVRANAEITAVIGDKALAGVRLSGPEGSYVPCVGLFSFIGAEPASGWLSGCATLDDRGFVLTDRAIPEAALGEAWTALQRRPLPFETSYPGLFAVGDIRSGSTKRVAAAVGEGSAAVRSAHEYLSFTT